MMMHKPEFYSNPTFLTTMVNINIDLKLNYTIS